MKSQITFLILIPLWLISAIGCDDMLRDNLLIIDSVSAFEYAIDSRDVTYSETERLNLQSVINDIDGDVEDVTFYNITMFVKNIYDSSPQTSISGQLRVRPAGASQSEPLVNFSNITFEDFAKERSIFSGELPGITVVPGAIQTLLNYYQQKPAPVVDFTVSGTISRAGNEDNVKFDFVVKLYTQMATDP
ncbi:MAG: hypothetical protein EA359_09505 [Balneolaceae bacterium]|nr:MAG: hypothetical protein EA359_09505 [Balneolaceae bacterium]